jgi:hypothetical protein
MTEFKRWMLSRNSEQEQEKRVADLAHEIILLQYKVIEKDKRIAELEAQLPKVVVPCHQIQLYDNGHYTGICSCTCNLMSYMAYCPNCAAKLNWTEVEK